jgi:hypothetical protein
VRLLGAIASELHATLVLSSRSRLRRDLRSRRPRVVLMPLETFGGDAAGMLQAARLAGAVLVPVLPGYDRAELRSMLAGALADAEKQDR